MTAVQQKGKQNGPDDKPATGQLDFSNKLCDTWFNIRIDRQRHEKLCSLAKRSGMSMSEVVRRLIDGVAIREMPPMEYHQITAELHAIGNNLNQIARVANTTQALDRETYLREAARLREAVLHIQRAVDLR